MDDELRTLERAVAAAPQDGAARVALARALDRAGRLVEAARLLDVVPGAAAREGRALADDLWRRLVKRLRFVAALGPGRRRNELFVSGDGRLVWSSREDAVRALDDGRIIARSEDVLEAFALRRGLAWHIFHPGTTVVRLLTGGADVQHALPGANYVLDFAPDGDRVCVRGEGATWLVIDLPSGARRRLEVPDEVEVDVDRWSLDWAGGWAYGLAGEAVVACALDGAAQPRVVAPWPGTEADDASPVLTVVGRGVVVVGGRDRATLFRVDGAGGRAVELPFRAWPEDETSLGPSGALRALEGRILRAVDSGLAASAHERAWPGWSSIHPFADLAAVGDRDSPDAPAIVGPDPAPDVPGELLLLLPGLPATWLPDGLGLILERDERLEVWRCD